MVISRMTAEDVDGIAAIEAATFSDPWSKASIEYELTQEEHLFLAARDDAGEVLGYCGFWKVLDEGQICNVAVRSDMRGQGIGRQLMEQMLAEGRARGVAAFTLEVRKSNEPAISLYHSLGFEDAGVRKNFYEFPTEDAIIMWLRRD